MRDVGFFGRSGERRSAGLEWSNAFAKLSADVEDDAWRNAVRFQHRKGRWRGNYKCRKERDRSADIAIVMSKAVVIFGWIPAVAIGVKRCSDIRYRCEVFGMNMAKGQHQLDGQRGNRQPAAKPH